MLSNTQGRKLNSYTPDYVLFDLETTGISCETDDVIEISAVKVAGGKIVDEFSTLVNPGRPIPAQASAVNGITDEMVQKEREQVIDATVEDIRKCSELIRAFMDDHTLCVVGNAGKIEDNKDLFDNTKTIFTV